MSKTNLLSETILNLEMELQQQIHQFEIAFKSRKYGEMKLQIQRRIIKIEKTLRVLYDERSDQLLNKV